MDRHPDGFPGETENEMMKKLVKVNKLMLVFGRVAHSIKKVALSYIGT